MPNLGDAFGELYEAATGAAEKVAISIGVSAVVGFAIGFCMTMAILCSPIACAILVIAGMLGKR